MPNNTTMEPGMVRIDDIELIKTGKHKDMLGIEYNITPERIDAWIANRERKPIPWAIEFSRHCRNDLKDLFYVDGNKVRTVFGEVVAPRRVPHRTESGEYSLRGDIIVSERQAKVIGEGKNFSDRSIVVKGIHGDINDEWISSIAFLGYDTPSGVKGLEPLPCYDRVAFEAFVADVNEDDKIILTLSDDDTNSEVIEQETDNEQIVDVKENKAASAAFSAGAEAGNKTTAEKTNIVEESEMPEMPEMKEAFEKASTMMATQSKAGEDLIAKFQAQLSAQSEQSQAVITKQNEMLAQATAAIAQMAEAKTALENENKAFKEQMKFSQKAANSTKSAAFVESLKAMNIAPAMAEMMGELDNRLREGDGTIKFSGSDEELTPLMAFEKIATMSGKAGPAGYFVATEDVKEDQAKHPGQDMKASTEKPTEGQVVAKFESLRGIISQKILGDVSIGLANGRFTPEQANNLLDMATREVK